MTKKVVKGPLDQYVGIKIDPAMSDQLLESYDIGSVRDVVERSSEYLARRLDPDRRNQ
jgi:hypothetical protein